MTQARSILRTRNQLWNSVFRTHIQLEFKVTAKLSAYVCRSHECRSVANSDTELKSQSIFFVESEIPRHIGIVLGVTSRYVHRCFCTCRVNTSFMLSWCLLRTMKQCHFNARGGVCGWSQIELNLGKKQPFPEGLLGRDYYSDLCMAQFSSTLSKRSTAVSLVFPSSVNSDLNKATSFEFKVHARPWTEQSTNLDWTLHQVDTAVEIKLEGENTCSKRVTNQFISGRTNSALLFMNNSCSEEHTFWWLQQESISMFRFAYLGSGGTAVCIISECPRTPCRVQIHAVLAVYSRP